MLETLEQGWRTGGVPNSAAPGKSPHLGKPNPEPLVVTQFHSSTRLPLRKGGTGRIMFHSEQLWCSDSESRRGMSSPAPTLGGGEQL